jgi:hypothetical protein
MQDWDAETAVNRFDLYGALWAALAELLPHTDDGPFGAYFQHDPRGATVGLTVPAGSEWERLYDGWGRDRINVPQRDA